MTARLTDRARAAWTRVQTQLSLMRDVWSLLRSPGDTSLGGLAILVVASGLCPVVLVYVTHGVVDRLVAAIRGNGEGSAVMAFILWASAGGALMLLGQALAAAVEWKRALHEERLKEHITERIHEQSVRLDLAFYESPEFHDRLHCARDEATYRPAELCRAFIEVCHGMVVLAGLGMLLVAFGPWLPVMLFLAAIPVLSVVSTHALEYQRWRRRASRDERRVWYYDSVLTSAEHASELRLFDTGREFRRRHRRLRANLRAAHLALVRRRGIAEAGAAAGSGVVMGATLAWMAWRAIEGLVSLGQVAAFYQAFASGLSTMRSLLSGLARIRANGFFIEGLFEFLALEPRVVSPKNAITPPARLEHGIRFRNVTFRYAGHLRPALEGFNLNLAAGETAALVGPNGAGKTTLLKLLCRFYDPIEGSIELDGVDIRRFDVTELRRRVSAAFQPSVRYFETVAENVVLGGTASVAGIDIGRACRASGAAGFIETLPGGYDTPLGTRFEAGTDLSAGEWQRLAVARALARPSEILLLDEPTSSLDPWSEREWFRNLRGASAGRTTLIVTHRLATAMQADRIYVMEGGRIVESGTHEDLIARGGLYAGCATHAAEPVFARATLSGP